MIRWVGLGCLALGAFLVFGASDSCAQEAEELLPTITRAPGGQEPGFTSLGRTPGAGGFPFENLPGMGEPLLGGRPGPAFPRVPAATTRPGAGRWPRPRGDHRAARPTDLRLPGVRDLITLRNRRGSLPRWTVDRPGHREADPREPRPPGKGPRDPQVASRRPHGGSPGQPVDVLRRASAPYGGNGGSRVGGSSVQNGTEYDINFNHPLDLNGKRERDRRRQPGQAGARGSVPGCRPR